MNKYYDINMNKRNIQLLGLIIISLLVASTTVVNAQIIKRTERLPLTDVYQEYIFNLNQFYNFRKTYESNRSKFIAYKTVSAREEALISTVSMLESSRVTMLRYLEMLEKSLQVQEDFNARVKNALINDITTHKSFLVDSAATIDGVTLLDEAVVVSQALQLRHTYVRASATQSLTYIDVMTAKKRNDNARTIVLDFKTLVAGYPSDNKNREVVEKWTEETLPELAENESLLNDLIETMYPSQASNPLFENMGNIKTENISRVNSRHIQYSQRFKEINQIAREAYKEL